MRTRPIMLVIVQEMSLGGTCGSRVYGR